MEKEWTDRDIEEAKISVFQRIDAPQSVSQEGMERFLGGLSEEMVRERRERLLDAGSQEIKEVARELVVKGMEKGRLVVLGEKKGWVGGEWDIRDMGVSDSDREKLSAAPLAS